MNVLFVCTGNICRSPLAEGILKKKYSEKKLQGKVDSCGFESFHLGDPPDPRAQQIAITHGINISTHKSRLFNVEDFENFDKIFVMDSYHYQSVVRVARHENDRKKVDFILNVVHPGQNRAVEDPYYDHFPAFETVFDQLDEACEKLTKTLLSSSSL
ncbi:MAG: low molecular weight phosphotyrosine protein phosphatase [Bacteroidales bacterium]|nr:low molecular weight phosphotyrosine protein phosphatase [Bacteroidales bacterium]